MVRLIGVFRLLKACLLIALGLGALKFLHHDLQTEIEHWLRYWEVDPDSHFFRAIVSKVINIDDRSLALISAGTFFYAALFLIEGVGLLMLKHWAEIFTVVVTGSFIPVEIYHLFRHASPVKVVVILVNVAIVIYLIRRLKNERKPTPENEAVSAAP